MSHNLTDVQQMIRDTVRDFAEAELKPHAHQVDEEGVFPLSALKKLGELGLLGLPIPEAAGGGGGDRVALALMMEQLGQGCASTAVSALHHLQAALTVFALGQEPQRQTLLPGLLNAEMLACFTRLAPDLYDPELAALPSDTPTATMTGDGLILNGVATFGVNAGHANVFVITARTLQPLGVRVVVLKRETAGLSIGERETTLGIGGADVRTVFLKEVRVPSSAILGTGDSRDSLRAVTEIMQVAWSALALGLSQAALSQAVDYARQRRQFGKPIGTFPGVAFRIADMIARQETARLAVFDAARRLDADPGSAATSHAVTLAKLVAPEAAKAVCYDAIQVFGGNGYSREYPLERLWRDAKLLSLLDGSPETQRNRLAAERLGALS